MKKSKGIDGKLDDAWSLIVKLKAGSKCEKCFKTSPLNSHHVYSRSKLSVRWDIINGCCLCVGCHTFSSTFSAHKTPTEFTEWIKETRGEEWYNALRIKAHSTVKWHLHEKEVLLEELNRQIKSFKQ